MASVLWLPVIFATYTLILYFLAINLPTLNDANANNMHQSLKFPSCLEDLHSLATLLNQYKDKHTAYVLVLFCTAYIYKQSFAIPGSVFLNLLGGALYGVSFAFPLTCFLTAVGATNCYTLSKLFGKQHIIRYFSTRIAPIQNKVEQQTGNSLFLFLLSLRLFPMAPNWVMNMAAPIINIPVHWFFFSVLFGLMPYNFVCVEAGCILSEIKSTSDILTTDVTLKLVASAVAALVPGMLMKRYECNASIPQHYNTTSTNPLRTGPSTINGSCEMSDKTQHPCQRNTDGFVANEDRFSD